MIDLPDARQGGYRPSRERGRIYDGFLARPDHGGGSMKEETMTPTTDVDIPVSIRRVVAAAVRAVDPTRVILYGSRARGDGRENSDYDLAFVFPEQGHSRWVRFLADYDAAALTLLPVDLLDWNEASPSLRAQIDKEGITLYERGSHG
jgi:uncharacterized protein